MFYCPPPLAGASRMVRILSTAAVLLVGGAVHVSLLVLMEQGGVVRTPWKEADMAITETAAIQKMWIIKNLAVNGTTTTGMVPSISQIPAQTASYYKTLGLPLPKGLADFSGETIGYKYEVVNEDNGEFSIVAVARNYGETGSGRRSFLLPCTGGDIRGIDPEKQDSPDTTLVSRDSPIVASENEHFPPNPGYMNKEPVLIRLSHGTKKLVNILEVKLVAYLLTRSIADRINVFAGVCVERHPGGAQRSLLEEIEEEYTRGESVLHDLEKIESAIESAGFLDEKQYVPHLKRTLRAGLDALKDCELSLQR
jgi:hypothetical protein